MSERIICPNPVLVGPDLVAVVLDLAGRYTLYLDVGGTAQEVKGVSSTTHCLVVSETPTPTVYLDYSIKVVPNYFQNGKQFCIYGVHPARALTGELAPGKMYT